MELSKYDKYIINSDKINAEIKEIDDNILFFQERINTLQAKKIELTSVKSELIAVSNGGGK